MLLLTYWYCVPTLVCMCVSCGVCVCVCIPWCLCVCVYPLVCMYHLVWMCKFGKFSNGHRILKCQFSFQSQRRTMLKNVQTIVPLHSFHMLERLGTKSFKLGFSSMWEENYRLYKLDLEKAEGPEINGQHSLDHRESNGIPEKHILLLYWLH